MECVISITRRYPEWDLLANTTINGRRFAARGNRTQVNEWVAALIDVGKERGDLTFTVTDTTQLPEGSNAS